MRSTFDYVPAALTREFREAQGDGKFQGWLKMQEAAAGIVFPIKDVPEIRGSEFTKDGLPIVEEKLLEWYDNLQEAFSGGDQLHRTMRSAYYIGETYRQSFEGQWVAIPKHDDAGKMTGAQQEPARSH